mgnify:CR=1 FL=1
MERALISGLRSVSVWGSLSPPRRDTNPSQVSSQQTLIIIYRPRKDGKVSFGENKNVTQMLKYRGSREPGTSWSETGLAEGRDLTNYRCQPQRLGSYHRLSYIVKSFKKNISVAFANLSSHQSEAVFHDHYPLFTQLNKTDLNKIMTRS